MRYNTTINNVKAKEWKLNIQQAYLFAWLYELPSWADKVIIEGQTYYFASKTKAVTELPILTEKRDTMYRYYKQLQEKDLIDIKKIDGKDYIALTVRAKEWNGTKSDTSENYPTYLGNKSELPSEINPTYNNTIYDNRISDDDVYKTITANLERYIANKTLVKAVLENNDFSGEAHLKKRLEEFNKHLSSVDQNLKTWKDYTSHFLNWHKKNKNGKTVSKKSPTDVTL